MRKLSLFMLALPLLAQFPVNPGSNNSGGGIASCSVATGLQWMTCAPSSGTLSMGLAGSLTQNQVLATPNGSAGAVGLRALVAADIPSLFYVTSVGLSAPSWLTVSNSPINGAGTLTFAAATGQTSHQVIGTCGSATSFAPCSLVAGDLPSIPLATGVTGTLPAANLPTPTASTLGGIESITSASHNWVAYIDRSGVPHQSQPACGDLSNAANSCSTDATNASNITAGTHPLHNFPRQLLRLSAALNP
jgi:hypothetical protein